MSSKELKRISVSLLNSLTNPRQRWLKQTSPELFDNVDDTHFRIGRAVDCLLTCPEKWEQDFEVIEAYKPTGAMAKFVAMLPPGLTPDSPIEEYGEAYLASGYKRSIQTVINDFWSNPKTVDYYRLLKERDEKKTYLSRDEVDQVLACVRAISENEFARHFFKPPENCEKFFQVRIEFDYFLNDRVVPCTAVLDGIIVDHEERTITPFDLKTTSRSVYDFASAFINHGYFRQAAFYSGALYAKNSPVYEYLQSGYKLNNFCFVVVETKPGMFGPVIIYEVSEEWIESGFKGIHLGDRYYKGINELIEDYYWHEETGIWYVPREIYERQGRVKL